MEEKKISVVLSGGGVRSLAHIGLLQALKEENIIPNMVAGTSGGALIGGLYASGIPPEEMLHFFKEIPLFNISLFAFGKPGFVDSSKYIPLFEKFFGKTSFEELVYPLTVAATNLISGKITYFDKGDFIKPLIASSALPPYFSPIEIDGDMYSDGGILDNFPINAVEDKSKIIIGSFVSPLEKVQKKDLKSTLKLLTRVYNIGLDASHYKKFEQCDYVFIPEGIKKIGILDSRMIKKAYQIGYDEAIKNMDEIKKSIQKTS